MCERALPRELFETGMGEGFLGVGQHCARSGCFQSPMASGEGCTLECHGLRLHMLLIETYSSNEVGIKACACDFSKTAYCATSDPVFQDSGGASGP